MIENNVSLVSGQFSLVVLFVFLTPITALVILSNHRKLVACRSFAWFVCRSISPVSLSGSAARDGGRSAIRYLQLPQCKCLFDSS